MKFRILWGFDLLIALVVVFFFFWGLSDGTVSAFNIGLWLVLLLGVGGVVWGGWKLRAAGRTGLATGLLLILAFPGFMYVLFLLVVLIGRPRWN
jgi:hypothetical protein